MILSPMTLASIDDLLSKGRINEAILVARAFGKYTTMEAEAFIVAYYDPHREYERNEK